MCVSTTTAKCFQNWKFSSLALEHCSYFLLYIAHTTMSQAIAGSTGSWSGGTAVVTSIDYNSLLSDLAQ